MSTPAVETRLRVQSLLQAQTPRPYRNIMHVSDFATLCVRKNYWDRIKRHKLSLSDGVISRGIGSTEYTAPQMLRGTATHMFLEAQGERHYPDDKYETRLALDVVSGRQWNPAKSPPIPESKPIIGTVDMVFTKYDRNFMVDYKTCETVPRSPKSTHIMQLAAYKFMWQTLGLGKIHHTVVSYITPDFHVVSIETPQVSSIEQSVIANVHDWYTATPDKPPNRPPNPYIWLCASCPHLTLCEETGM